MLANSSPFFRVVLLLLLIVSFSPPFVAGLIFNRKKSVPIVDQWRVLSDGKLTGIVKGHPVIQDGKKITTSPLSNPDFADQEGVTVTTLSGSSYLLNQPDASYITELRKRRKQQQQQQQQQNQKSLTMPPSSSSRSSRRRRGTLAVVQDMDLRSEFYDPKKKTWNKQDEGQPPIVIRSLRSPVIAPILGILAVVLTSVVMDQFQPSVQQHRQEQESHLLDIVPIITTNTKTVGATTGKSSNTNTIQRPSVIATMPSFWDTQKQDEDSATGTTTTVIETTTKLDNKAKRETATKEDEEQQQRQQEENRLLAKQQRQQRRQQEQEERNRKRQQQQQELLQKQQQEDLKRQEQQQEEQLQRQKRQEELLERRQKQQEELKRQKEVADVKRQKETAEVKQQKEIAEAQRQKELEEEKRQKESPKEQESIAPKLQKTQEGQEAAREEATAASPSQPKPQQLASMFLRQEFQDETFTKAVEEKERQKELTLREAARKQKEAEEASTQRYLEMAKQVDLSVWKQRQQQQEMEAVKKRKEIEITIATASKERAALEKQLASERLWGTIRVGVTGIALAGVAAVAGAQFWQQQQPAEEDTKRDRTERARFDTTNSPTEIKNRPPPPPPVQDDIIVDQNIRSNDKAAKFMKEIDGVLETVQSVLAEVGGIIVPSTATGTRKEDETTELSSTANPATEKAMKTVPPKSLPTEKVLSESVILDVGSDPIESETAKKDTIEPLLVQNTIKVSPSEKASTIEVSTVVSGDAISLNKMENIEEISDTALPRTSETFKVPSSGNKVSDKARKVVRAGATKEARLRAAEEAWMQQEQDRKELEQLVDLSATEVKMEALEDAARLAAEQNDIYLSAEQESVLNEEKAKAIEEAREEARLLELEAAQEEIRKARAQDFVRTQGQLKMSQIRLLAVLDDTKRQLDYSEIARLEALITAKQQAKIEREHAEALLQAELQRAEQKRQEEEKQEVARLAKEAMEKEIALEQERAEKAAARLAEQEAMLFEEKRLQELAEKKEYSLQAMRARIEEERSRAAKRVAGLAELNKKSAARLEAKKKIAQEEALKAEQRIQEILKFRSDAFRQSMQQLQEAETNLLFVLSSESIALEEAEKRRLEAKREAFIKAVEAQRAEDFTASLQDLQDSKGQLLEFLARETARLFEQEQQLAQARQDAVDKAKEARLEVERQRAIALAEMEKQVAKCQEKLLETLAIEKEAIKTLEAAELQEKAAKFAVLQQRSKEREASEQQTNLLQTKLGTILLQEQDRLNEEAARLEIQRSQTVNAWEEKKAFLSAEAERLLREAEEKAAAAEKARKEAEEDERRRLEAQAKRTAEKEAQRIAAEEERLRLEAEKYAKEMAEEEARKKAEEAERLRLEAAAAAQAKRVAKEEAAAEARRIAEEEAASAIAEAKLVAEEEIAATEAKRIAEQEAAAAEVKGNANDAKKEAAAQAKRIAKEEAASARKAKQVAKKEAAAVEAKRLAEQEAATVEAKRIAKEEAFDAVTKRISGETVESKIIAEEEADAAEAQQIAVQEASIAETKRIADVAAAEAKKVWEEELALSAAEAKRIAEEETAASEAKRIAREEAATTEAKRTAELEAVAAEKRRIAEEETAAAESMRIVKEPAVAEAKRIAAQDAATEARRIAEEEAAAEAKRIAQEEAAAVEAKRIAQEEAAASEAKKIAEEKAAAAKAMRIADEEAAAAEAQRIAAEVAAAAEARRIAEEEAAAAEAKRIEEEEAAEADRNALEEAAADAKRTSVDEAQASDADVQMIAEEEAVTEEAKRIAQGETAAAEANRIPESKQRAEVEESQPVIAGKAAVQSQDRGQNESRRLHKQAEVEAKQKNATLDETLRQRQEEDEEEEEERVLQEVEAARVEAAEAQERLRLVQEAEAAELAKEEFRLAELERLEAIADSLELEDITSVDFDDVDGDLLEEDKEDTGDDVVPVEATNYDDKSALDLPVVEEPNLEERSPQARWITETIQNSDDSYVPSEQALANTQIMLQQIMGHSLREYDDKESFFTGRNIGVYAGSSLSVPIRVSTPNTFVEYTIEKKAYDFAFGIVAFLDQGPVIKIKDTQPFLQQVRAKGDIVGQTLVDKVLVGAASIPCTLQFRFENRFNTLLEKVAVSYRIQVTPPSKGMVALGRRRRARAALKVLEADWQNAQDQLRILTETKTELEQAVETLYKQYQVLVEEWQSIKLQEQEYRKIVRLKDSIKYMNNDNPL